MLNPDVIPLPIAIPLIVGLWTVWGALVLADRRARRRVTDHTDRTAL